MQCVLLRLVSWFFVILVVRVRDSLCPTCLFLESANETVGRLWRGEVEQKEEVVHDSLGAEYEEASQERWLRYREEGSDDESAQLSWPPLTRVRNPNDLQEVHTLVLGLLEQCVDPAAISTLKPVSQKPIGRPANIMVPES